MYIEQRLQSLRSAYDHAAASLEALRLQIDQLEAAAAKADEGVTMLSVADAARRLSISRQTMYRMLGEVDENDNPIVPFSVLGATYKIPTYWIEDVLRGRKTVGHGTDAA